MGTEGTEIKVARVADEDAAWRRVFRAFYADCPRPDRSALPHAYFAAWAGRKLDGYRNIPPADKSAVVEALVMLSHLAVEHPEITEIEINPFRALPEGGIAIDIRIKD